MSLCASVYMCFVVTCWERADLLALVCGVNCKFVTFRLVSWVRCGTWLYRFLIFAPLLTWSGVLTTHVWGRTHCLAANVIGLLTWRVSCTLITIHVSQLTLFITFAYILSRSRKQEMSQSRDECPQRNWSSIRHIWEEICSRHKKLEWGQKSMLRSKLPKMVRTTPPSKEESTHQIWDSYIK